MNTLVITPDDSMIRTKESAHVLESGKILLLPQYHPCHHPSLMSESILDSRHKNVSYDYKKNKLGAYAKEIPGLETQLIDLLRGYAEYAVNLVAHYLPDYAGHLQWGRTSFRPAQIKGRASSKRKDDTRLHVDSFVATPVHGRRILRVFCNINPQNEARVWHVGEPFADVVRHFVAYLPAYRSWVAALLKHIRVTKSLRSSYDHYMLHLHDAMKLDDQYQSSVKKTQIDFPAQCTWMVFTDQVSHAALSGQYVLEQTFYLPVERMVQPLWSPFHELQKAGCVLT